MNLVDESIAERMNICASIFRPARTSSCTRDSPAPSSVVKPPRIAESPVNLECRELSTTEIGRNRVVMGEVLRLHVRDEVVDADHMHVDAEKLRLIGRMHGAGWYTKTTDLFQLPRLTFQDWKSQAPNGTFR